MIAGISVFSVSDGMLRVMEHIYEHDSYSLEIYCMGKYALPTLRLSTVIVYHTDRQTRLKLYTTPHDSSDNLPLVLQTIINAQVMLLKGKEASQT